MAALCGLPIIRGGIGEVRDDPVSVGIEQAQTIRGFRVAARRRGRPLFERSRVVSPLIGLAAALYCRSAAAEPNPREPDHGSRIASLTPRITPRNMYINTERDPTLMSAVKVMPGTSRKLSGTAVSLTSLSAMRAL